MKMETNYYFCEDYHLLCLKCGLDGCSRCQCNKRILLNDTNYLDRNIRKPPPPNTLIDSLFINQMKKPPSDEENHRSKKSQESVHSDKCLLNLDDQVSFFL